MALSWWNVRILSWQQIITNTCCFILTYLAFSKHIRYDGHETRYDKKITVVEISRSCHGDHCDYNDVVARYLSNHLCQVVPKWYALYKNFDKETAEWTCQKVHENSSSTTFAPSFILMFNYFCPINPRCGWINPGFQTFWCRWGAIQGNRKKLRELSVIYCTKNFR